MPPLEDVDINKTNEELKEKIANDVRAFLRINFALQREPVIDALINSSLIRYCEVDEPTGLDLYPENIVKTIHDEIGAFTVKVDGKQLFDYLREVENQIGTEALDAISDALSQGVISVRTILMLILMLEKAKDKAKKETELSDGLCGNCNHLHEKVAMIGFDNKVPLMNCGQCECDVFRVMVNI